MAVPSWSCDVPIVCILFLEIFMWYQRFALLRCLSTWQFSSASRLSIGKSWLRTADTYCPFRANSWKKNSCGKKNIASANSGKTHRWGSIGRASLQNKLTWSVKCQSKILHNQYYLCTIDFNKPSSFLRNHPVLFSFELPRKQRLKCCFSCSL